MALWGVVFEHDGQDKSGEAPSATYIRHMSSRFSDHRKKLSGIKDMPVPKLGEAAWRYQIDRPIPLSQKLGKRHEVIICFT